MTANATHPGRITIPGTDLGVRGTLVAEPQTENMLLALDDRLALGPVKVDTDAAGVLEAPGLVVPIVASVLWLLRFEPHRHDVPPFVLGYYNLNTSGVDLKDLVEVTVTAVDVTAIPGDAAVGTYFGNPSSVTRAAADAVYSTKPDNGGKPVGKGELVYNVADYSSFTAAFTAMTGAGRAVLKVPAGTYTTPNVLVVPSGIHIDAEKGAILRANPATNIPRLLDVTTAATNVKVTGLTIDGNGKVTGELLRVSSSTGVAIEDNTFTDTSVALRGVRMEAANTGDTISVQRNRFDGVKTPVSFAGSVDNLTISRNRIKNWTERAVYIVGTATDHCTNLVIERNHITDIAAGGTSRYPIRVEGSDTLPHVAVTVCENYIKGPGTAYGSGGTADQIALVNIDGLTVRGNHSYDGGDGGITIAALNPVVTGNVVKRPWTAGLFLGASSTPAVKNATVTGNSFIDIGMGGGTGAGIAGVRAQNVTGASVVQANTFSTEVSTGYRYAVSLNTCTSFTIGSNAMSGITQSNYYSETGNTGTRFAVADLFAIKAADTTRNNTATAADDPDLTVNVDANAVYVIDAYLATTATTTADLKVGFAGPTGTTNIQWTLDGPPVNVSTAAVSPDRTARTAGSAIANGGAALNLVSKPSGTVFTSTTAGAFRVQWAQNTAEVSDAKMLTGSWLRLRRVG